MIITILLIFIVAIALPSFQASLSPILFTRLSSIVFIYTAVLWLNALYIESIVSGVSLYSELFHVTEFSQMLNMLWLFVASLILILWPSICFTTKTIEVKTINNKRKKKSNIINFSSLKKNTVNKPNNLPPYKIGAAQEIHILNKNYLIIMFSMLIAMSIMFFYSSVFPILSLVVQLVITLMISFIVSNLITSFVLNGLKFSDDISTAFLQKVLFSCLLLILICYIIYNYNIIDTIYSYIQSNSSSNQLESSTSNQISNSNSVKSEDFVIPSPNETFTTAKNNLYNFIDNHPVDVLLYSILALNIVSLFLMFSLSISLLYKLFTKSTLELKFIDKILSENYSTKVKYYINKIIQNSNRLNTLHIIFMILVIIFSNIMAIYLLSAYIFNLELISKIYLGLIK